jgi:CDGSH-type Zn-finger protein
MELEVGKDYWYCGCGLSKNQPFCDGSHKGTPYKPQKFTVEKEAAFICQCRQSKNQPFCDGTHKYLDF